MRIDYYENPYDKTLHNVSRLFFIRVSRLHETIDGVEVYKAISAGYTEEDRDFSGTAAIIQFDPNEGKIDESQFDFDIKPPTDPLDPDGIYVSINGYQPEKIAVYDTYQQAYVNNSVILNEDKTNTIIAVRPNLNHSFYELGWLVINHFDEYHSQSANLGYPNNDYPWALANNEPMEQIKQYVGETTSVFTKGHFYQRVSTTEYYTGAKWVEIDIGGGGGGGTSITGMKWTSGTSAGPIPIIEANNDITGLPIPIASTSESGVVNTMDQTFSGNKTFEGSLTSNNEFILNGIFKGKEGVNIVSSLPASGDPGQIVFLITP